ncbi:hypothetical protein Hanom_Chr17g01564011 [Helianthus anomalus]
MNHRKIDWRKMSARRTKAEEKNDRWRFLQTGMIRLLVPEVSSSTCTVASMASECGV